MLCCTSAGPWLLSQPIVLQHPHLLVCLPDPSCSHCSTLQLHPFTTYPEHSHHLHHLVRHALKWYAQRVMWWPCSYCNDSLIVYQYDAMCMQWDLHSLVLQCHAAHFPSTVPATSVPSAPGVPYTVSLSSASSSTCTQQALASELPAADWQKQAL